MTRRITFLTINESDDERLHWMGLLRFGFPDSDVLEAKDGETGLELCRTQKFDCVLLDYHLPDISGLRLLTHLNPRPRCPSTAVIVLSQDHSFPQLETLLRNNGAQSYIPKSKLSAEELSIAIRKAMAAVALHTHTHTHTISRFRRLQLVASLISQNS
jgi:CheY-like chemotaxis protein